MSDTAPSRPTARLVPGPDGSPVPPVDIYALSLAAADAPLPLPGSGAETQLGKSPCREAGNPDVSEVLAGHPVVIPVVREEIAIEKKKRIVGRVSVRVTSREREEAVDVPLASDVIHIERVTVNRPADGTEGVRQEGDVTIVPVFAEVLVVEKKLVIKEEIRMTRRKVETSQRQTVTLREEVVEVNRTSAGNAGEKDKSGTIIAKRASGL